MMSHLSRPGPVRWKAADTQHPNNSIGFLDLEGDRQWRHDEDAVGPGERLAPSFGIGLK
jgi:hypothetical protein